MNDDEPVERPPGSAGRRPAPASGGAQPRGGWSTRGYLPHLLSGGVVQTVTYRLTDALPATVLTRLASELESLPPGERAAERRAAIDSYLDAGHGSCVLRNPSCAAIVRDNWLRFDGDRYRLIAWIVMPNHVHVIVELIAPWTLDRIVQSWKSYTAKKILAAMTDHGSLLDDKAGSPKVKEARRLWQREYWDRYVRDARHFEAAVAYLHENPVRAGLCRRAADWPWSSAASVPPGAGRRPALPGRSS